MACTTTAVTGCGGSITGAAGSEVRSWTVNLTQELIDVTSFSSGCWRTFLGGLKGGTGSYEGVGATLPTIGSVATATFKTASATTFASGAILINDVQVVCQVEDAVIYTAQFSFCGAIT